MTHAEEDDPAFARREAQRAPAAPSDGHNDGDDDVDPTPGPATASPSAPAEVAQAPPPKRAAPRASSPAGSLADADADDNRWLREQAPGYRPLHVRLAYRHLTIPEVKDMQQHLGSDDFNGLAIDLYPLSTYVRLGFCTQAAFESGGDFLFGEGLTLGLTLPHARISPFVEGGVHGGVGQRSVWVPIDDAPTDFGTLFLMFTADVGVEARFGRQAALSVAVGLQRSSFYLSLGDPMDPVVVIDDVTTTFKVGVGF